jgi:hypothetical protein
MGTSFGQGQDCHLGFLYFRVSSLLDPGIFIVADVLPVHVCMNIQACTRVHIDIQVRVYVDTQRLQRNGTQQSIGVSILEPGLTCLINLPPLGMW